jgi:hypothetical protein
MHMDQCTHKAWAGWLMCHSVAQRINNTEVPFPIARPVSVVNGSLLKDGHNRACEMFRQIVQKIVVWRGCAGMAIIP